MIVTVEPINGQQSLVVRGKYPPNLIVHEEPIPSANPRDAVTIGVLEHVHETTHIARSLIYDALREAWNQERRAA